MYLCKNFLFAQCLSQVQFDKMFSRSTINAVKLADSLICCHCKNLSAQISCFLIVKLLDSHKECRCVSLMDFKIESDAWNRQLRQNWKRGNNNYRCGVFLSRVVMDNLTAFTGHFYGP